MHSAFYNKNFVGLAKEVTLSAPRIYPGFDNRSFWLATKRHKIAIPEKPEAEQTNTQHDSDVEIQHQTKPPHHLRGQGIKHIL